MALFAKSKVERFQEGVYGSSLGPGDYDPSVPKSTQRGAGAVSLGFTSRRGGAEDMKTPEAIPEQTEAAFAAARDRRSTVGGVGSRRPSSAGNASRLSVVSGASRLLQVEPEQQAKQLAWSEREREKLQEDVTRLRERKATLAKNERQARTETAKAVSTSDALVKRAEAADRKVSTAVADTVRLEAAEAEVSQLSAEITEARRAAKETAGALATLQNKNDNLESQAMSLHEKLEAIEGYQEGLRADTNVAREREQELDQRVTELRAVGAENETELVIKQACIDRATARVEEAQLKVESLTNELASTKSSVGILETLSARLSSELEEHKELLQANDDSSKGVHEAISSLRAREEELVARVKTLEGDLEGKTAALERASEDVTAKEEKLSVVEDGRDDLRDQLALAETKLKVAYSEKSWLERELCEEKSTSQALGRELASAQDSLVDVESKNASVEERLATSESESERLKQQLEAAEAELVEAEIGAKKLEVSIAETVSNVAALQERLGDALADGVEYADEAIRSEERLRSSEDDCAALWQEREEAKERLCAAFVQGRALEESLEESMLDVARMQDALDRAEARLASSIQDGEDVEEELAASRDECTGLKKDLEKMAEKHATAASEARLLRASRDESRAEVSRLETALDGAQSQLAEAGSDGDRLRGELATTEAVKNDLNAALAQVDTGAMDFVALEAKLSKVEAVCDRLRSSLESAQMTMAEVTADAERAHQDLHNALLKCTALQEKLGDADGKVAAVAEERQQLEEALSESAASRAALEHALSEAELGRAEAIAASVKLGDQLYEAGVEKSRLLEKLEVGEGDVATLRESLAEALVGRGAAASQVFRLEVDLHRCVEERDALSASHRAAVEKANGLDERAQALEMLVSEGNSEVARLRNSNKAAIERADGLVTKSLERVEESQREVARLETEIARLEAEGSSLRARGDTLQAELAGLQATIVEKDARVEEANAIADKHRTMSADYEAEGERLMDVLDGIEASFAAGNETTAELKLKMADIQGIGAQLGEKLAAVVAERNEAQSMFEVAQGALVASAAHRRRLSRDLDSAAAEIKELREKTEACRRGSAKLQKEIERLNEVGQTQALGASALLTQSKAKVEEEQARLQLLEVTSAQAIALAKKDAYHARSELEAALGEIREMRGLNNGLCRAQTEGGKAMREAGIANRQVLKLASENAALAGHTNNKQKIKHLQDLKKHNIRLLNDTAEQASELSLATAVLEAIGIIAKEEPAPKKGQGKAGVPSEGKGAVGGLHARGRTESNSMSPGRSSLRGGDLDNGAEGRVRRKPGDRENGSKPSREEVPSTPRSKSQRRRVPLQARLLTALESTAPLQHQRRQQEQQQRQQREAASQRRICSQMASTGCFASIKCGGLDDLDSTADYTAPTENTPTMSIADYLMDEKAKSEVRKVLMAQAGARLQPVGPE